MNEQSTGVSTSRSLGILLLSACFLFSMITGTAHAQCESVGYGLCLTTNRTTYNPGDTVIVTFTYAPNFQVPPFMSFSLEILPVPDVSKCGVDCPLVEGTVSLGSSVTTLILPGSTPAGHYDVEVVTEYGFMVAAAGITVT